MAEKKIDSVENAATENVYNGEELVERFYFKDNGRYKDDIYVAIGLENCYVPRGQRVMIKRKFADAIDESMRQDAVADAFMSQYMSKS